jgi:hypothetical protein
MIMERKVIHPEFPFTDEENAAAWILLGKVADDAIQDAAYVRAELNAEPETSEEDSGWFSIGPRVQFVGDFGAAIHLAADIRAHGTLLSAPARHAWLSQWTLHLSDADAEGRLSQLDHLGPDWSAHRAAFRRLLTSGTL